MNRRNIKPVTNFLPRKTQRTQRTQRKAFVIIRYGQPQACTKIRCRQHLQKRREWYRFHTLLMPLTYIPAGKTLSQPIKEAIKFFFAYRDVGKGREQDAEALRSLRLSRQKM